MSSKGFYKSDVPPRLIHKITSPVSVHPEAPSSSLSLLRRGSNKEERRKRPPPKPAVVRRSVEVWTTPCIVTCFGKSSIADCDTLINPANPDLSGVKNFPYFPRGGPVPNSDHRHRDDARAAGGRSSRGWRRWLAHQRTGKHQVDGPHRDWQPLGYVSSWGGMEVGSGMMYPVTVVDGLVHLHGGTALQAELALLKRLLRASECPVCPVGEAVVTSSGLGSALSHRYDAIVHTAPPFYDHDDHPRQHLRACYHRSMELAAFAGTHRFASSLPFPAQPTLRPVRVAVPLLGSGARGFPAEVAMAVAAHAVAEAWLMAPPPDPVPPQPKQHACGGDDDDNEEDSSFEQSVDIPVQQTLAFGLLEETLAEEMAAYLDRACAGLRLL